jgi:hypothetical protein
MNTIIDIISKTSMEEYRTGVNRVIVDAMKEIQTMLEDMLDQSNDTVQTDLEIMNKLAKIFIKKHENFVCQHVFVSDYIDVDLDTSVKIEYCEKCYLTATIPLTEPQERGT